MRAGHWYFVNYSCLGYRYPLRWATVSVTDVLWFLVRVAGRLPLLPDALDAAGSVHHRAVLATLQDAGSLGELRSDVLHVFTFSWRTPYLPRLGEVPSGLPGFPHRLHYSAVLNIVLPTLCCIHYVTGGYLAVLRTVLFGDRTLLSVCAYQPGVRLCIRGVPGTVGAGDMQQTLKELVPMNVWRRVSFHCWS